MNFISIQFKVYHLYNIKHSPPKTCRSSLPKETFKNFPQQQTSPPQRNNRFASVKAAAPVCNLFGSKSGFPTVFLAPKWRHGKKHPIWWIEKRLYGWYMDDVWLIYGWYISWYMVDIYRDIWFIDVGDSYYPPFRKERWYRYGNCGMGIIWFYMFL